MLRPIVYLTQEVHKDVIKLLRSRFTLRIIRKSGPRSLESLRSAARKADALVPMLQDRIDRTVLTAGKRLKIVANYAVGVNNIDLAAAKNAGIVVTNTPGVLTDATADLTMALILGLMRRLSDGERLARSGKWKGWGPTELLGLHVTGKTIGIIGMGRIGQAVAERAKGFKTRTLYWQRTRLSHEEEGRLLAEYVPIDRLLAEADIVTLHTPLTGNTHRLIGRKEISRMKRSAVLINTSRGPVVDEKALIEALAKRRIWGAGLDVYEEEPKIPLRLRRLPNVLLLPHLGSATEETRIAMGRLVFENLTAFFSGQEPPTRVV